MLEMPIKPPQDHQGAQFWDVGFIQGGLNLLFLKKNHEFLLLINIIIIY